MMRRRPAPKPDHRSQTVSLAALYRPADAEADRQAGRTHALRARRLGDLIETGRQRDLTDPERSELAALVAGADTTIEDTP